MGYQKLARPPSNVAIARHPAYRLILVVILPVLALVSLLTALIVSPFAELERFRLSSPALANDLDASRVNRTVDLDFVAEGPTAIFLPNHGGRISAWSNDQLLPASHPHQLGTVSRYRSISLFILPDQPAPGSANKIRLEKSQDHLPAGFGNVYVGPSQSLERFSARRVATVRALNLTLPIACAIALLTSFALIFFSSTPLRYTFNALALLISLFIENDGNLRIFEQPPQSFESYYGALQVFAIGMSVATWWERPRPEHLVMAAALCLQWFALIGLDLALGINSPSSAPFRVALYSGSAALVVAYWLGLNWSTRGHRNWQAAIAQGFIALVLIAFAVNPIRLYANLTLASELAAMSVTKLLAAAGILGLVFAALSYELTGYRRRMDHVADLQRIVSGSNLGIEQTAQRLKTEIERRVVLEERERFTRDLHDGIGGQLLSILLKVRDGKIDANEIERDVSQSLADLRLISASLDDAGDNLVVALQRFRVRAAQQLDAARIELDWRQLDGLAEKSLPARSILDLLRALQEAIANAIRHSNASSLTITVAAESDLIVEVADNGIGIPEDEAIVSGSGLRNMAIRMERLDGKFEVVTGSAGAGARLRFRLPLTSNTKVL